MSTSVLVEKVLNKSSEQKSNKDSEIIQLYNDGNSSRTIASITGVSNTQVRRILTKNNVSFRSTRTDESIEKEIVEKYIDGQSAESIARDYNFYSGASVIRILKRCDLYIRNISEAKRIYDINHNFLNEITTENQAYFLGFMYADGNVHKENDFIKIAVHERDVDVLKKIIGLLFINCEPKISSEIKFVEIENEDGSTSKKETVYKYFTCTSFQLKEDLIRHGCVTNKTFKLELPLKHIKKELFHHFLRGLYDGDGSIAFCKSGNNEKIVSDLTGFKPLLLEIKEYYEKELNLTSYLYPKKNPDVAQLQISAQADVVKILKYLYKDSTIYLNRKYKKHLETFEKLEPKIQKRAENAFIRSLPSANPRTKYTVNFDCIDIIDTEEKAYLFAFFMLKMSFDVENNVNKTNSTLRFSLQEKYAKDIFSKFLDIIFIGDKPVFGKDRNNINFTVNNVAFYDKMKANVNIKNKTLPFDIIPKHLFHHFIRGVYDFCGSIKVKQETKLVCQVNLTRDFEFLSQVQTFLLSEFGFVSNIYQSSSTDLCIGVAEDIKTLLEWMYKDATIYIEEKHEKYKKAIEICKIKMNNALKNGSAKKKAGV